MKDYYVYFHRNALTNEVFYVGLGKGRRYKFPHNRSNYWKNYVNKYGFIPEIRIDNISKEQALYFENKYIRFFGRKINGTGCLINITEGLGRLNISHSEETKKKISEKHKGKIVSISTKHNMRRGQLGKQRTEEHRKNISLSSKGKKPIIQKDLSGNFIKEWTSINEAAKAMNVTKGALGNVVRGIKPTCKKFIWEFKN